MSRRKQNQKTRRALFIELLDQRIVLDAAGFASPVFYEPTPYLSEADTPNGFIPDPTCPDCVRGLENFEDGDLDFGITITEGEIIDPNFSTGTSNLTDSVDSDDGVIDGTGQSNGRGYSYFTRDRTVTVTFPSLMQSAGMVWTDGPLGTTDVVFEAFDQNGNSLGTKSAGDIADESIMGTTGEDRFFGVSFGDGRTTGVTAIRITNLGGGTGLEIDHIQFANCEACCDDPIDLELTKSVDATLVSSGDTVTWTLDVTNDASTSSGEATGVQIRDVLPAGVTFVRAATTNGTYDPATGIWTLQRPLGLGNTDTLTLVTTVDARLQGGSMVTNSAEVFAADQEDVDSQPNNDDGDQSQDDEDSAKVTLVNLIDLEVTKTANVTAVSSGDSVVWTISLLNNADNATVAATGVGLVDVLPEGVTLVRAVPSGNGVFLGNVWSLIDPIAPGDSATLQLTTTVNDGLAGGTMLTNTAYVAAANETDFDSTPGDNNLSEDDADSAKVTVGQVIDLELKKTVVRDLVEPGEVTRWTVQVTNNGDNANTSATGVTISDVLPAGLTFVNAFMTDGTFDSTSGIWTLDGPLGLDGTESLTILARVDANVAGGAMLQNVAQVASADQVDVDSVPGNDDGDQSEDDEAAAKVTLGKVIDLEVAKDVSQSLVSAGDSVVWTVAVTNNAATANSAASGIGLVDLLPFGVTLTKAVPSGNGVYLGNVWSLIDPLQPGETATLQLTTTINDGLTGGSMLTNVAYVAAANEADIDSTPGPNSLNEDDTDSAKVTVIDQIDLELTKSVDATVVQAGSLVTWEISLTNNAANANTNATGVVVGDVLPSSVTLLDAATTGNSTFVNDQWIINEPVSPGEVLTLRLTTRVNDGFDGTTIANVAQVVSADQFDVDSQPNNDNGDQSQDDEDRASVIVEEEPLLMLSGHSYVDVNNDGIFQDYELPLLGVRIDLMGADSNGNPVNMTTFTNVGGFYKFNDLAPGTYMVKQTQPVQFVDGKDTPGNLGGESVNDKFTVALTNESGVNYDFGEFSLRGEFVNKRLYLTSTPLNEWNFIDVRQSSIWYSYDVPHRAFLQLNAAPFFGNGSIDLFDANMIQVGSFQFGAGEPVNASIALQQSGTHYIQISGDAVLDSLSLNFVEPDVTLSGDTVTAVATQGDDHVELSLGSETHVLNINGLTYEYDADVVREFLIGSSEGDDQVVVHGTFADDRGSIIGTSGTLESADYKVRTFTFDKTTFHGGGGSDNGKLYGSSESDTLSALPHDVTLTTPANELIMKGFGRVDSYGRGGSDYASLVGTASDDLFFARDNYALLKGGEVINYTKGFERVDSSGGGGNDTAKIYDSAGDDSFVATPDHAYLVGASRIIYSKGFEQVEAISLAGGIDRASFYDDAASDDRFKSAANYAFMTNGEYLNRATNFMVKYGNSSGGLDSAEIAELHTNDQFAANGKIAHLVSTDREDRAIGFDRVDLTAESGATPKRSAAASIDFVLGGNIDWI